jgi:hypothetical protein
MFMLCRVHPTRIFVAVLEQKKLNGTQCSSPFEWYREWKVPKTTNVYSRDYLNSSQLVTKDTLESTIANSPAFVHMAGLLQMLVEQNAQKGASNGNSNAAAGGSSTVGGKGKGRGKKSVAPTAAAKSGGGFLDALAGVAGLTSAAFSDADMDDALDDSASCTSGQSRRTLRSNNIAAGSSAAGSSVGDGDEPTPTPIPPSPELKKIYLKKLSLRIGSILDGKLFLAALLLLLNT